MVVAILAILASVVVPVLATVKESEQVSGAFGKMQILQGAILTFKSNVTLYPGKLSHLGTQILSTDISSCSGIAPSASAVAYAGNNTKWANAGPYYYRAVSPTGGLPTGIGVINDQLLRTSANNAAGTLDMIVPLVRLEIANEVNVAAGEGAEVNNADLSNSAGTIQWDKPDAANLVTLRYKVSIINKC